MFASGGERSRVLKGKLKSETVVQLQVYARSEKPRFVSTASRSLSLLFSIRRVFIVQFGRKTRIDAKTCLPSRNKSSDLRNSLPLSFTSGGGKQGVNYLGKCWSAVSRYSERIKAKFLTREENHSKIRTRYTRLIESDCFKL